MCLSTVYKNTLTPETVAMRNVMRIECRDGVVILTDLMERQVAIEGTLEMANLVDGVAIVKESQASGIRNCPPDRRAVLFGRWVLGMVRFLGWFVLGLAF